MICEKCGSIILTLEADMFDHEGADSWVNVPAEEVPNNAVYIDLPTNWTGYELDEDEQVECVRCPRCHKFPFKGNEIQIYTIVRCVMFKHTAKEET